jgi:hypothetical protein
MERKKESGSEEEKMKVHELKVWPDQFEEIVSGQKRHEYRMNDRDFQSGDLVRLRKWRPVGERYLGPEMMFVVGSISRGPEWGIKTGHCVFTLLDMPEDPTNTAA